MIILAVITKNLLLYSLTLVVLLNAMITADANPVLNKYGIVRIVHYLY